MNIKFPLTDQMKLIRPTKKTMDDAKSLAECLNTWSDDDSWGGSFGSSKFTPERVYEDWLKNSMNLHQLVVDEDGVIQGYCSIDKHWEDEDTLYVGLLGVSPKAQKKGFGKALLLESIKKTIENGKKRLDLHTWPGNIRSVPVYKKTGFMWRPDTSVLMENYLPAILSTKYFENFFKENEFYKDRILEILQEQDKLVHLTMDAYQYTFAKDSKNSLKVFIDRHAKEISGFVLLLDGKKLSVQLKPSQHKIYLGIDAPIAELEIINETSEIVNIKCKHNLESGIIEIVPDNFDLIVNPGETKIQILEPIINLKVDSYDPEQDTHNRTKSRFTSDLIINGYQCSLGIGFVPEDAITVSASKSTAYFGKLTKFVEIPIGYVNNTSEILNGNITIKGDGLKGYLRKKIKIEAYNSSESIVELERPENHLVKALEWKLRTEIVKNEEIKQLPFQKLFVNCFTKPGVVAYNDYKRKLTIIGNEQLKFSFMMKSEKLTEKLYIASIDKEIDFYAFSMDIGKPYPSRGSEFWTIEKDCEIIQTEDGIILKQVFLSKTEKPGLEVTRWIELEAGKPFLSTYFDMKNTNESNDNGGIIRDIAVKNGIWGLPNSMKGPIVLPLKNNFLVLDEPSLEDPYDYPVKAEDYSEPWIAREPHNEQGVGFGFIWNYPEVEKIKFGPSHWGPAVETKPFDLESQQKKRIGSLTIVIGQNISQLTRRIWLKELNGKSKLKQGTYKKGISIVNVNCGESFINPIDENSTISNLSFISKEDGILPITINNLIEQKNPIKFSFGIESNTLNDKKEIEGLLEDKKDVNEQINKVEFLDSSLDSIFNYKSSLSFLDFKRKYDGLCIPYSTNKEVSIKENGNEWEISNGLLSFKTSPSHGASLHSLKIGNKEIFLSHYPSKEAFVWFKFFLGGLHPHFRSTDDWDYADFFTNIWSDPISFEKDGWKGVQLSLDSTNHDNRIKNISLKATYITKAESPVLLLNLHVINNSNKTAKIETGFMLFTKIVEALHVPRRNHYLTGKISKHRRFLNTDPPYNWVIADYGNDIPKMLIIAPEPQSKLAVNFANANDYSSFNCNERITLSPNESFDKNLLLVFSSDLELLKTYHLREAIVKL